MIGNEKVLYIIRRSYIALFRRLVSFAILLFLPLIFFYLYATGNDMGALLEGQVAYPLIVLGISAYYLFVWLLFFFNFIDYYLDVWIITTERIVDINQRGFFSRVISEQMLFRVQDATSEIKGVLPTFFSYGNLNVQTAGEINRFVFYEIHDPNKFRDIIIKLCRESQKRHKAYEL